MSDIRTLSAVICTVLILTACAESDPSRGVFHDPYENVNRQVHDFNKSIDTAVLEPAAEVYGQTTPKGFRLMLSNLSKNLSEPRYAVNHLLQGDVEGFLTNLGRFAMNTTLGIGGLADPAGALGVYQPVTTFGQTMATWGVPEGAYIELPFAGPSSERDTAGRVVDFFLDPLYTVGEGPRVYYIYGVKGLDVLANRYDFDSVVDSILYESEDSYARARLLYLQSVHGAPAGETEIDDLEDPYAE